MCVRVCVCFTFCVAGGEVERIGAPNAENQGTRRYRTVETLFSKVSTSGDVVGRVEQRCGRTNHGGGRPVLEPVRDKARMNPV